MVGELTPKEMEILQDKDFLILKNNLSEKIINHLSIIERKLEQEINNSDFEFPAGTFLKAGKISRGERYLNLPYFILDFPRLFTQKEVFVFRSMLWWGQHYSCTLHIQGKILQSMKSKLISNIVRQPDVYFCINSHPWEYHYESSNYLKVESLTIEMIETQIKEHEFVKLSLRTPLSDWAQFLPFTVDCFARFISIIR